MTVVVEPAEAGFLLDQEAPSLALAIPDPRQQPVPMGWAAEVALPAIEATEDWDSLDEYEARLRAMASYVESFRGDGVEFEKALRIVEKRRGELLGVEKYARVRNFGSEESHDTRERWRKIARHWDKLGPLLLEATKLEEVSQAALLRAADNGGMAVHYSSKTPEWATPQDLFDALHSEFAFQLDVCATDENTKCPTWFTEEQDGLAQPWTGTCWMNPPYGDEIRHWVKKAHDSGQAGATVVCLVPARVDTGWWWDYCRRGEVRFLRGRLKFGGGENSAPFPSAVVIFGREPRTVYWER